MFLSQFSAQTSLAPSLKAGTLREAIVGRDISLGHGGLETAKIDCRYLGNESKCGLLHEKKVFLLFLDLAFRLPRGYRLSNVEFKLSFADRTLGAHEVRSVTLSSGSPKLVLNVALTRVDILHFHRKCSLMIYIS